MAESFRKTNFLFSEKVLGPNEFSANFDGNVWCFLFSTFFFHSLLVVLTLHFESQHKDPVEKQLGCPSNYRHQNEDLSAKAAKTLFAQGHEKDLSEGYALIILPLPPVKTSSFKI